MTEFLQPFADLLFWKLIGVSLILSVVAGGLRYLAAGPADPHPVHRASRVAGWFFVFFAGGAYVVVLEETSGALFARRERWLADWGLAVSMAGGLVVAAGIGVRRLLDRRDRGRILYELPARSRRGNSGELAGIVGLTIVAGLAALGVFPLENSPTESVLLWIGFVAFGLVAIAVSRPILLTERGISHALRSLRWSRVAAYEITELRSGHHLRLFLRPSVVDALKILDERLTTGEIALRVRSEDLDSVVRVLDDRIDALPSEDAPASGP